MDISLFDYDLPEERIAQTPVQQRDRSRLFVIDRKSGRSYHRHFFELPEFAPNACTLVRNNARVLHARLPGRRPTGGKVECLLLFPEKPEHIWRCLVRPASKLSTKAEFFYGNDYHAVVLEHFGRGEVRVAFDFTDRSMIALSKRIGRMPLPPYIRPSSDDSERAADTDRYQTVFAHPEKTVAAAAPTAGLHFTGELFSALEARGITIRDITLHVGLSTFQPVLSRKVEDHPIQRELYEIPAITLRSIQRHGGRKIVAVGTTTVRTLEDYATKVRRDGPMVSGHAQIEGPFREEAEAFLYPPASFILTDALITNFHLPRSTLMYLVAAFLAPGDARGIKWLKELYAEAIAMKYRFYSYGDAMLIL